MRGCWVVDSAEDLRFWSADAYVWISRIFVSTVCGRGPPRCISQQSARNHMGSPLFSVESEQGLARCPAPAGPVRVAGGKPRPQGGAHPPVQRGGHTRRPSGAHERPVGRAMVHAPRRGAGHSGPAPVGALRRRSFPPATFRRASSAEAARPLYHRIQRRTYFSGRIPHFPLNSPGPRADSEGSANAAPFAKPTHTSQPN